MTREEYIDWLCRLRADLNNGVIFTPWNKEFTEALTGILEQEPNTVIATGDGAYYKIKALQEPYDFARWVASEIFDDMWEHNKDSFAEIACRKLAKLGIVRAKGDEWELVEPTCDTCEYTTAAFNPCNACKDKSEYKPQERSEDAT